MKKVIPLLFATIMILAALFWFGVLQFNHPSRADYPVRGVDVSHYQGAVDWETLSGQGLKFAYIKATEGSSSVDERFHENWTNAQSTSLRLGAYHFFSFDSGADTQAANFIETVTLVDNMLPPVVDVEKYGKYTSMPSGALDVLGAYMDLIEDVYGMRPVIYTTQAFYPEIAKAFPDHDIWIRSVYMPPKKDIEWKFWQYSNRTRLNGYRGEEKYIDMNVFRGNEEEFEKYGRA